MTPYIEPTERVALMTERLTPRQPQWHPEPYSLSLPIEDVVTGPYPDEVAVSFHSNGDMTTAVVPSDAVDRENKTVKAMAVGIAGEYTMLALPAGSSGSTLALVRTEKIRELVGQR